jgi:iron complex transport system substrate-binding protein
MNHAILLLANTTRRAVFALAVFAVSASAAIAADKLQITHGMGRTDVAPLPTTVLVFDLGMLDTLDALGITVKGVPKWKMPPSLAKYEGPQYTKIGSLFEPDLEAVYGAKPDLIIVGARTRDKYDKLASIAPTIDLSTDPADFYGSVERNAATLGRIFGKQAEVAARLAYMKASIAKLKLQTANIGNGLVLLTTGGKISAFGSGSRFGVLHDVFGLKPADPGLKPAVHGQAVSYEYLLKTDPDWLFVVDRDAAVGAQGKSAAQLLDNPLVARTKAWKQNHVVYLDPVRMYLTSAGLRAEQETIDTVAAALAKP